jgi:hypothetical protein
LNAQSRQKLAKTHVDAGALYIDEYSMLQSEMNNAAALRTTYARENTHALDKSLYHTPRERFGCMAILGYSGDHLQLPPVPESSSLLASLKSATNEHKVGSSIFRNAELVFRFEKAMRVTDAKRVEILEVMRTPGGKSLTSELWKALEQTEISATQPDLQPGWYNSCYCWSITTMSAVVVARQSAIRHKRPLVYVQAIDEPQCLAPGTDVVELYKTLLAVPSLSQTKRLPGIVLFHQSMRMRLTTTLQQPFAVQDAECTIVGFEPEPADDHINSKIRTTSASEMRCSRIPKAIYVKLDDCDLHFLPPGACATHRTTGHDATCAQCLSAVQPGVFAVKPISRVWRHYLDGGRYVSVKRKQFPLLPLASVNLYSMQGTTADPGLYAYWMFPKICSKTVQWLIVYVMLSRPRSLAQLKSINLTKKIREIIQEGPPEDLVQTFQSLFSAKIEATTEIAQEAAKRYGLLPECFR